MEENIVVVDNVSKTFRLPHERSSSLKSAVINFHKRKKSYEKQVALKDVSFEIKKGEFYGIVGRNGSGKSTMLKLLAGIYSPSKGAISVLGKLTPFIELGVGFNPDLTGRENVYLNGALLGFNRKEMNAMYDDIVRFAELRRFMDQKLKNYSSGMQVRLAFSIAIRARSDILLLDEVLAVGDAAFQQKCFNYFEELKLQKKTVVFVTHDMTAVKRFCSRAMYMKDGSLIKIGTPLEIADIYIEENIEAADQSAESETVRMSDTHSLSVKLKEQKGDKLHFEMTYSATDDEEMYVGASIIYEGVSVAEINSNNHPPLVGSGKAEFIIDTGFLNPGVYLFDAALFKKKNRQLLYSIYKKRPQFVVKGDDTTKGAALKLADTWKFN